MKRVKESGAFFRKKKKAKEAELKKHEGAMLKFVTSSGSNVFLTIQRTIQIKTQTITLSSRNILKRSAYQQKRKKQGLS